MQVLAQDAVTLATYPTSFEGPIPERGSGWDEDPETEEQVGLYIVRREIVAAKRVMKAKANTTEKRYTIAGVAPTTGEVTHDDGMDALGAAALEARRAAMGGGGFTVLDPAAAVQEARDALNRPVPKGEEVVPNAEKMTVRCTFCGHSWAEGSPEPLVACPSCTQYTQIRMMPT
jgi:hypothetical protein